MKNLKVLEGANSSTLCIFNVRNSVFVLSEIGKLVEVLSIVIAHF